MARSDERGAPATPVTARRVPIGELSLFVAEYGRAGPELVLIHGIGSSGTTWWPVIDALAERFRLIVPDLRGHGASDKPERGYLIPDYAADLSKLLAALEVERPMIVGHSLGGAIALSWASHNSSRLRRLVIEDTPLRKHPNVAELFAGWISLATQPVESSAAYYAAEYPHWTAEECRRRAETITSTALGVFTELRDRNLRDDAPDRFEGLRAITCPTLLIFGDPDSGGMVRRDDAERFARVVPLATIHRIPGGSHSLHRDRADEFLAAVVPFLLES